MLLSSGLQLLPAISHALVHVIDFMSFCQCFNYENKAYMSPLMSICVPTLYDAALAQIVGKSGILLCSI